MTNIQSIKEEINEKAEKDKEKEDLISRYLEGLDDELTKNSSKEDKTSIDDIPDFIEGITFQLHQRIQHIDARKMQNGSQMLRLRAHLGKCFL